MAKAELIIAGRRYALSCAPGQEARLEELGARFDQRVKELSTRWAISAPSAFSSPRACRCSMNSTRRPPPRGTKALDDRIRGLEQRAATMLADAAARIEAISRRVDEAS